MLCQKCGKRPATVHVQTVINGVKSEYHFCNECAREEGHITVISPEESIPANFMSALLEGFGWPGVHSQGERCPACGWSYDEFARTGFVGCQECYQKFGKRMGGMLRQIHGASKHVGKVPGWMKPSAAESLLSQLKAELEEAIRKEEYERAAELRDRIRELERKTC